MLPHKDDLGKKAWSIAKRESRVAFAVTGDVDELFAGVLQRYTQIVRELSSIVEREGGE